MMLKYPLLLLLLLSHFSAYAWPEERATQTDTCYYMTFTNADMLYAFDRKTGNPLKPLRIGTTMPALVTHLNLGYLFKEGSSTFTVVNLETNTILKKIKIDTIIGKVFRYCHLAFISDYDNNFLTVVDLRNATVLKKIPFEVHSLSFQNNKAYLVIQNINNSNDLVTLDLDTLEIESTIPVRNTTKLIVYDHFAYGLCEGDNAVQMIDLKSHQIKKTIQLEDNDTYLSSYEDRAFVFFPAVPVISIIELQTATHKRVILDKHIAPQELYFYGNFAYIYSYNTLHVLNLKTLEIISSIPIGSRSQLVVRDHFLYALNTAAGNVTIIDLVLNKIVPYAPEIPEGDYQIALTDTKAYGWGCNRSFEPVELFTLMGSPQNQPLLKGLPKNRDLKLNLLSTVGFADKLCLDFLFDPTKDQRAFWTAIDYFNISLNSTGRYYLKKALEELNPYARAMMCLAYTHGLWGVKKDSFYAKFFSRGADQAFLEFNQAAPSSY